MHGWIHPVGGPVEKMSCRPLLTLSVVVKHIIEEYAPCKFCPSAKQVIMIHLSPVL